MQTKLSSFLQLRNVIRRFVPKFTQLAATVSWKFRKGRAKTRRPLHERESAAVSSSKKDHISLWNWIHRELNVSTHYTQILLISKSGLYFSRSRKTGGTPHLATGLALCMTKSKNRPLHTGSTRQLYELSRLGAHIWKETTSRFEQVRLRSNECLPELRIPADWRDVDLQYWSSNSILSTAQV